MRVPEILAPAGSFEALLAAVENGADAVYLGGKLFSARAYATNFDDETMLKAIQYAHLRGVRIYVTVNTLIDNNELDEAMAYIKWLYDASIDGIIVQDFGLACLIRSSLPELEVHGSTQMTIHNADGAQFLANMGFTRVVLAREVPLNDIKIINDQAGIELEMFAHGALCISYSGQCLMSSLIGGRSGNRGRCAQPCRMTYTLVDKAGKSLSSEEIGLHLLSPRDLNTLELLPEICRTGVASLKFEGRMKKPEYVATVIRIYRTVLNRFIEDPEHFQVFADEQRQLGQIFNRDFTTGYLKENPGIDLMSFKRPNNRGLKLGRIERISKDGQTALVKLDDELSIGDGVEIWVTKGGRLGFTVEKMTLKDVAVDNAKAGETVMINISGKPKVGDRVFKTYDKKLMEQAEQSFKERKRASKISFTLIARQGEPIILAGMDEKGNSVEYTSEYLIQAARTAPATSQTVTAQLARLGDTIFELGKLNLDLDENIMLPASELNQARRVVTEKIIEKRLHKFHHPEVSTIEFSRKWKALLDKPNPSRSSNGEIAVRVAEVSAVKAAIESGADIIYVGGEVFRSNISWGIKEFAQAVELAHKYQRRLFLALPRIYYEKEKAALIQRIRTAQTMEVHGLMVSNLGNIKLAQELEWQNKLVGDFGLNVFNRATANFLFDTGVSRITLSPELTLEQIEQFGGTKAELECIVHGALPMMISEYCLVGAVLGGRKTGQICSSPCQKKFYGLKDRMNYVFPIEVDQSCRMHIFNPKELCVLEHLDRFIKAGIKVIRIEARRNSPKEVSQIVAAYRSVRDAVLANRLDRLDTAQMENSLKEYTEVGFTKGHYFRGVL